MDYLDKLFDHPHLKIDKVVYFASKMWYVAQTKDEPTCYYMSYFGHNQPNAVALYEYLCYNNSEVKVDVATYKSDMKEHSKTWPIEVIKFDSLDQLPSIWVPIEECVTSIDNSTVNDMSKYITYPGDNMLKVSVLNKKVNFNQITPDTDNAYRLDDSVSNNSDFDLSKITILLDNCAYSFFIRSLRILTNLEYLSNMKSCNPRSSNNDVYVVGLPNYLPYLQNLRNSFMPQSSYNASADLKDFGDRRYLIDDFIAYQYHPFITYAVSKEYDRRSISTKKNYVDPSKGSYKVHVIGHCIRVGKIYKKNEIFGQRLNVDTDCYNYESDSNDTVTKRYRAYTMDSIELMDDGTFINSGSCMKNDRAVDSTFDHNLPSMVQRHIDNNIISDIVMTADENVQEINNSLTKNNKESASVGAAINHIVKTPTQYSYNITNTSVISTAHALGKTYHLDSVDFDYHEIFKKLEKEGGLTDSNKKK